MINRVLIRMKVVQMLYSYLLTKSEFHIKAPNPNPTRDRDYANRLYVNLLLLITELSGYKVGKTALPTSERIEKNHRLSHSQLPAILAADPDLSKMVSEEIHTVALFNRALRPLYEAILNTEVYKKYLRARSRTTRDDVDFWVEMLDNVIKPNPYFIEAARSMDDFTLRGLDMAFADVKETLNEMDDESDSIATARKSLTASLDKAYELYMALLAMPVNITRLYELRLDNARNKFIPTHEDLNPNTRLLENVLPAKLAATPEVAKYLETHIDDSLEGDMLNNHLLDKILASDIYKEYIATEQPDAATDANFWRKVLREVILPDDELAEVLESRSVYWNDDIDIMSTFAAKTMKRLVSDNPEVASAILPKYKDEEDEQFGPTLFDNAVEHYTEYRALIDEFINTKEWDSERLAFMDVIIMVTAIAEMLTFAQIPIPVTLNEYIEIANAYSTAKSGKFINGVLYSVINKLKGEGRLRK